MDEGVHAVAARGANRSGRPRCINWQSGVEGLRDGGYVDHKCRRRQVPCGMCLADRWHTEEKGKMRTDARSACDLLDAAVDG